MNSENFSIISSLNATINALREENNNLRICNEELVGNVTEFHMKLTQAKEKNEKLTKNFELIQAFVNEVLRPEEDSPTMTLTAGEDSQTMNLAAGEASQITKAPRKRSRKVPTKTRCQCSGGCKNNRCGCFKEKRPCTNLCECDASCDIRNQQNDGISKNILTNTYVTNTFVNV